MTIAFTRRRQREATAEAVRQAITRGGIDVSGLVFKGLVAGCLLVVMGLLVWLFADVVIAAQPYLAERGFMGFLGGTLSSQPGTYGVSQGKANPAWYQFTGGPTLIAAGMTMAILVMPIVIITSAEAIRAVPGSLREAGFGVGATRSEVIRSHVLPYAAPGILTGTVLSFARAIGEAAPLLMVGAITGLLPTYGTVPDQLTGKFTALPMVIYGTLRKPESQGWPAVTAAVILVLMAVLLVANAGAIFARNYFERKRQ